MCRIDTRAGPSFLEGSDINNFVFELILSNNILYNLCFFCIGVSTFRKKFLIKDGMCGAKNDISLYIVYKTITIILISDEYYQFRM